MKNRISKVGLTKIKRASGNYYRIRYKLPGDKNHTYENIGYVSKRQAELIQAQRQIDFVNGKFNIPNQNRKQIALQRLIDEYYSTRTNLGAGTLKKYRSYSNRFIDFISNNFSICINYTSTI